MDSKKRANKKIILGIVLGVIIIAIIGSLWYFFNRKFEVIFDYNNGSTEEVLYIKYNKTIAISDIKDKDQLGNLFIDWFEVIGEKDGSDILSEKPFDFKEGMKKNVKLKAIYNEDVEKITISFDSRDGSKVDSLTIEKGSSLVLPENPTRSGYTFKNWETESSIPVTDGTNLSVSMTLYAVWSKNESSVSNQSVSKTYYCESGYTLIDKKCNKTEMIEATLTKESCANNFVKNDSVCLSNMVYSYASEKCPTGTTYLRPGYSYCYSNRTQTDQYTCANNIHGQYTNGYCYNGTSKEVEYSCPVGFRMIINHSASFDKSHECHAEAATIKTYSCPEGYDSTSGAQCIKTIVKDALVK